jgi:hypothetical protein
MTYEFLRAVLPIAIPTLSPCVGMLAKRDEVTGEWRVEAYTGFWWGNLRDRDHL